MKTNINQKIGEKALNTLIFLTGKKEKYNLIQEKIIKEIFEK